MIVDIETYTDADYIQQFVYQSEAKIPIDLTNHALRMMVRARPEDATTYLDLTSDNGHIIIQDAVAGKFALYVSQLVLSRLTPGIYVQSLIRTDTINYAERKVIWRGTWTHNNGPTRWKYGTLS